MRYIGSSTNIDRHGDAYPVYWVEAEVYSKVMGKFLAPFSVVQERRSRRLACASASCEDRYRCEHVRTVQAELDRQAERGWGMRRTYRTT